MSSDREVGTLAGLIERLAGLPTEGRGADGAHHRPGTERLDAAFARRLAAALHGRAAHVGLPEIEALGFEDVVVTFYMDREMRLVVTGSVGESGGEGTVRWREADFGRVPVEVHTEPRPKPYTFATLDFSVRGHRAVLEAAVPPLPAGVEVTVRCLSTLGDEVTYRVAAHGQEVSAAPEDLKMVEGSG